MTLVAGIFLFVQTVRVPVTPATIHPYSTNLLYNVVQIAILHKKYKKSKKIARPPGILSQKNMFQLHCIV